MWRGGSSRCLCSLLARSFVCGCYMISTMLRFHTTLIEPCRQISRTRLSDKALHQQGSHRRVGLGGAMESGTPLPFHGGYRLPPISRHSVPSAIGSELRPLPSTSITRPQRYYGPLRHPGRHAALTAWGFPCCVDPLVPTCRRHYPGGPLGSDRSWDGLFHPFPLPPWRRRPSPIGCRVGVHIGHFEACSTFTRVTACRLAASPKRHICLEASDGFVTSTAVPIAAGWSNPVARWELHPLKINTFHTAHNRIWPREALCRKRPEISSF